MHKFHPIAEYFPLLVGIELDDLVKDIKAHGLLEKMVLHEDMILDGRNRERACELAGVEPKYEPYSGDHPITFVISKNIHRRHMTAGQRALAGSQLETLAHGGNRQDANLHLAPTRSEIAKDMKVSPRSIATAKTIIDPALKAEVKSGKTPLHAAARAV
jgi:ParB-like chromosome segregation protein Spo0J